MTRRRAVGLVLALAFLAIQLVRPERPGQQLPGNGPIEAHLAVPGEVMTVLREACYDCHSDETRWPFYARIAPVSWLIARHVRDGRGNLDFSHWSNDPDREPTPTQRLEWTCREATEGSMPPLSYRLLHREGTLTSDELATLCEWTETALRSLESRETVAGQVPQHDLP